jgi:hypothetical protein
MSTSAGPDGPEPIANSYRTAGRVAEAIELQERVVAEMERILGEDHPTTITSRQALDEWRS